jgi:hypothetical protein
MTTDYEQRLKKTDLFISDFVPTEYTEYTPHQSAFLKQIQKRALVEYEHDETNTIIVNDDLKPLTTSSTSTTTTTAPTTTSTTTTTTTTASTTTTTISTTTTVNTTAPTTTIRLAP